MVLAILLPVTPAVSDGVVKIDASNYWMLLHPIVGFLLRLIPGLQLIELGGERRTCAIQHVIPMNALPSYVYAN